MDTGLRETLASPLGGPVQGVEQEQCSGPGASHTKKGQVTLGVGVEVQRNFSRQKQQEVCAPPGGGFPRNPGLSSEGRGSRQGQNEQSPLNVQQGPGPCTFLSTCDAKEYRTGVFS